MLTPCLMKTYFTNVNLSDENLENGNQESKNLWRQVFLGFPPIHWAIENKQLEVVKLICNFDPDYNRRISCEPACSKFFYVPFLTAISYNYSDIVKWMVTNDKVITQHYLLHFIFYCFISYFTVISKKREIAVVKSLL